MGVPIRQNVDLNLRNQFSVIPELIKGEIKFS